MDCNLQANNSFFVCTICKKDFKDPQLNNHHQTKCCNKHFCESCLVQWITEDHHKSCPHCKTENVEFVSVDTCTWCGNNNCLCLARYRKFKHILNSLTQRGKPTIRQLACCHASTACIFHKFLPNHINLILSSDVLSAILQEIPPGFKFTAATSNYDGRRPRSRPKKKKLRIKRLNCAMAHRSMCVFISAKILSKPPSFILLVENPYDQSMLKHLKPLTVLRNQPMKMLQCNGEKGSQSNDTQKGKKNGCHDSSGTGSGTHSSSGGVAGSGATGSFSGGAGGGDEEDDKDRDSPKDACTLDSDCDESSKEEEVDSEDDGMGSAFFPPGEAPDKNRHSVSKRVNENNIPATAHNSPTDSREPVSQIQGDVLAPSSLLGLNPNDTTKPETVDGKHAPVKVATIAKVSATVATETVEGQNSPSVVIIGQNASNVANFFNVGSGVMLPHVSFVPALDPGQQQEIDGVHPNVTLSPAASLPNFNVTAGIDPLDDIAPIQPLGPLLPPVQAEEGPNIGYPQIDGENDEDESLPDVVKSFFYQSGPP